MLVFSIMTLLSLKSKYNIAKKLIEINRGANDSLNL